jgi:hypothetical protein
VNAQYERIKKRYIDNGKYTHTHTHTERERMTKIKNSGSCKDINKDETQKRVINKKIKTLKCKGQK